MSASATVVFRSAEPAHKKVYRLACCAYSYRGIRFRSQYCRKTEALRTGCSAAEHLKPQARITPYDPTRRIVTRQIRNCMRNSHSAHGREVVPFYGL